MHQSFYHKNAPGFETDMLNCKHYILYQDLISQGSSSASNPGPSMTIPLTMQCFVVKEVEDEGHSHCQAKNMGFHLSAEFHWTNTTKKTPHL